MPTLQIIIASTRPGRVGLPVARWFVGEAEQHGAFDLDVVDLAELGLPFLDEPKHPRLQEYEHAHTKRWSARVAAADAFVYVMPEYNFGINDYGKFSVWPDAYYATYNLFNTNYQGADICAFDRAKASHRSRSSRPTVSRSEPAPTAPSGPGLCRSPATSRSPYGRRRRMG